MRTRTEWNDGCLEYRGFPTRKGVGRPILRYNNKTYTIARLILGVRGDLELDDRSLQALHGPCDNPQCITPSHLYAGTPQRNRQDAIERGTDYRGEHHWNSKLTEQDVSFIKTNAIWGPTKLASHFGVHVITVADILGGRTWKYVEPIQFLTIGTRKGELHPNHKLTKEQVLQIRTLPGTLDNIAHQFGVNRQTIHRIKNGKTWKHL